MSSASAPLPSEAQPLSEPARLGNIFFEPGKTFADLKANARWWSWVTPWLAMAVLSLVFVVTVERQVGFEQVSQNTMRYSPKAMDQLDRMPAEQRERQLSAMAKGFRFFSYAFPFVWLILLSLVSAVLLGTFNFGMGAETSYKVALAVVMYASFPASIVKTTLAIVALLAGVDPEGFLMQNPVATNPGYFMEPGTSPFLLGVATNMDVLMFWTLALTGIGFAAVSKVKRGTAIATVFIWWGVFTLFTAGMSALSR